MNETTRTLYAILLIIFLGLAMILMKSLSNSSAEITENELMNHIKYLSHEERGGRYPGSRESKDVISYLIQNLKSYR